LYSSGTLRIHELTSEERAVYATLKPERLPQHVAIIMDGNGRWAGHRSLKRFLGHQQGAKSVQLVTETASRIGLPWLTLYAFSLENNLRRPRAEVNFLMRLLKTYLESNVQRMMDNNVRMNYIGRTHELPAEVQDKMRWAEEATARNTGTTLTLALNYGGRSELVDAFRSLAAEMKLKHISPERITEEDIHRHLYTAHMPDPDLLIRTSGEMRFRTICCGRSPTPRSSSPSGSGPTSAASICWKPSPTSSAASAATAAWRGLGEVDEEARADQNRGRLTFYRRRHDLAGSF
jgi:undecaprenyl diphosphate synthase